METNREVSVDKITDCITTENREIDRFGAERTATWFRYTSFWLRLIELQKWILGKQLPEVSKIAQYIWINLPFPAKHQYYNAN